MNWLFIPLGLLGAIGSYSLIASAQARARRRRVYEKTVGLRLAELIALLPPHLQERKYVTYMVAPENEHSISVGLIYKDPGVRRGVSPNVGLEFDRKTGTLVRVHEDGVGLGMK